MKVPKGCASRDIQQSTGNLEERSVLETDWRLISLNIHQLGLRKKSPNDTVVNQKVTVVVSWETPLLKGWVTTEEHKIDIRKKERMKKWKECQEGMVSGQLKIFIGLIPEVIRNLWNYRGPRTYMGDLVFDSIGDKQRKQRKFLACSFWFIWEIGSNIFKRGNGKIKWNKAKDSGESFK